MSEIGVSLDGQTPKQVDQFLQDSFDYVITVCDHAKETCPCSLGSVRQRLHLGFDDPAKATGTKGEILSVFRRVRDESVAAFQKFYERILML